MKIKLKGINVVRKMLASGKVKEYHYLGKGKGAPCFWSSGGTIKKGTVGYVNAFKNAGAPQATPQNTFSSVLEGIRRLRPIDFRVAQGCMGRVCDLMPVHER